MRKRRDKTATEDDSRHSTMEIRASIRRTLEHLKVDATTSELPALKERRSGEDRRGWQSMPPMPFADSEGVVVTRDRRRVPDRRVSNISVAWKDRNRD